MADSRKARIRLFSRPERDRAGHSPTIPKVFRTALGWTACGRNGKYGVWSFWAQFGVVMMADVSTAKENVKRVFYVRFLNHPIYLDLIATRPEIRLDKLENDTPEAAAAPIISAAHAYQVSSARDELPAKFHVNKDLLGRAPNLLIVSTGGAGYDTVNVKDCTDAGVLVVNQTGGNADAVAAHVLGMMLMLSKQVVQVNNALRKGTMQDRNLYMGNDINNKTIGIVGLGNVGRRIAKLCATVFDMTGAGLRSLSRRKDHRRAQRHQGRARRIAAALRLRLDQLPARRHDPQHDQHARSSA